MVSDGEVPGSEEQPEVTPTVSVKCRPNRLHKLIGKLNIAQRAAVQRIGFGGLLHLKLRTFPLSHVPEFLEAFSDGSHVFRASELKEFMVTKYDVYDCFMLPVGEREMEIVPTGHMPGAKDEKYVRIKQLWRKKFKVKSNSDSIPLGDVFNYIESEQFKDGGDEFCRLFVLLSISSFLAPTLNNGIEIKLLKVVEDVSVIPEYDWCSYVLECLANAAAEARSVQSHLLGCIPFLMITYFQRYDYRGKSSPDGLPLIQHWDLKTLSKRLKDELDVGPLGRLTLSKVKYPRCQNKTPDEKDTGNTMLAIAGAPKAPLASPTPLLISTSGTSPDKKFIQIELPPGVEDDDELKARAVDGVHELYLKIQRNAVAFYSWYTDAAAMLKNLTTGVSSSSDLVPSQATQAFFEGAKVKEYVEEVGNLASQMKKYNDNAPSLSDVGQEKKQVAKKKTKASKKRKTKEPKFEFTPTVEPVSLAEDSDLGDKAGDAAMSQVMETADFYNTAELNEACRREEEECRLDLTDDLTQLTDRQILEKIYSPDDVEEAYTKPSLNEEQESLGGEVPDTSGAPEKSEHVVEKCKSEATNKVDADVVGQSTEDGSSSVQLKFISTADIENALQGLTDIGHGGGEEVEDCVQIGEDEIVQGMDMELAQEQGPVSGEGEASFSKVANKVGADVVVPSIEDGSSSFQLKFIATADIDNALKKLSDSGDSEVAQGGAPREQDEAVQGMDMGPPQDQGTRRGPESLVVRLVAGVDVDVSGAPTVQDEAVQGMDMEPLQDQGPCRGPEPLVVGLVLGEAVDVSGAPGVK